jgi:hypothetical protein
MFAQAQKAHPDQHVKLDQKAPESGISIGDNQEWSPSETGEANVKYWVGLEKGIPPFEVAVYNHHAQKAHMFEDFEQRQPGAWKELVAYQN